MHSKPMSDSEGEFEKWQEVDWTPCHCRKCQGRDISYRAWESSCGGYTDHQFRCNACGFKWWIEGSDA